jgi:PAS domain S-box-containing protein
MSRIGTASDTPPGDSHRVLLLLEPGRDRELFADRLDDHEVVIGTPDESPPDFDLCLVDMSTYPSVQDELAERKATEPTYMPVLLVVGQDVREAAAREAAETADDVLALPTNGVIFRNRVESLLRARRQSLALDAQRERFRSVTESAHNPILTIDTDGVIQYANAAVADVFGHEPSAVVGESLTMLMPERFRTAHETGLKRYVETGERQLEWTGIRFQGRHADGHEVPLLVSFAEYRADGERRFAGIMQDVSEQVRRQGELERTVDMLDRAESIAGVGGWQYDPENDELLWADQVYQIHGLDTDYEPDVEGAIEFYHPDDRPAIQEAIERALEAGDRYDLELRIVRPDGEERWVRAIGEPERVDGRRVLRGAFQDIHDRKEREQALERTVEQLRQTRDIADVSGWEYDPATGDLHWDDRLRGIYDQLSTFEPTEESVLALYTPESRTKMRTAMRRAIVDFESFDVEVELDTEPARWARVTGTPVVEDGRTTVVRGVTRDITQQRRREEFLRRYERIVETSSEPIYTLDRELQFTLVNGALADLVDREPEALLGEHVATLLGDAHAAALAAAVIELSEARDETTIETTVADATGGKRRYQTIVSRRPGTDGFVCVSHDITDLTEHERRISVLDRVLRHNLRNKMNLVLAQAATIRERTDEGPVLDAVAGVESASRELLSLGEGARQFKTAVDPGATELVASRNVAGHAAHVVEEARLSYDDAIIEADLPDETWARAHQELELALSELVDNATTHAGPDATVSVTVTGTDDEVVVRVADDGPGIPDLEREAISAGSESPLQHATGLGLWFVRWTVTNSDGSMTIADRDAGGAVVELRLPAAAPPEG